MTPLLVLLSGVYKRKQDKALQVFWSSLLFQPCSRSVQPLVLLGHKYWIKRRLSLQFEWSHYAWLASDPSCSECVKSELFFTIISAQSSWQFFSVFKKKIILPLKTWSHRLGEASLSRQACRKDGTRWYSYFHTGFGTVIRIQSFSEAIS